jgi:hypothetical protein
MLFYSKYTVKFMILRTISASMKTLKVLSLFFIITCFTVACTGKNDNRDSSAETADDRQEYANLPWPALARLRAGENPIWLEFGQDGPRLIESPAAASLTPYAPWPHAKYVAAMAVWKEFLVMAVNRDGFLVFGPVGGLSQSETAELVLFRTAAGSLWDPYTTESFFIWEGKPAALLYRNDFFGELAAPTPVPQVYALDLFNPVPVGASVPALEIFPSGGNWETELLRRGPDGFWYYRMKQKGQAMPQTAYFRAEDLNVEGKKISFGEWMNSGRGEAPENIPRNLARVLGSASEYLNGITGLLKTVSPDFEGQRIFSLGSGSTGENSLALSGYCRRTPENLALVMLPDGRGLYSYGEKSEPGFFSLSALPEGFVYTGVAVLGNVLIASWEEQQEAEVGAAGFMVVNFTIP